MAQHLSTSCKLVAIGPFVRPAGTFGSQLSTWTVLAAISGSFQKSLRHMRLPNSVSPLLYSLFTYDLTPVHGSTTVVGLISDELAYREEVQYLTIWCANNNLDLNIKEIKEIIVDFGKTKGDTHSPMCINRMWLSVFPASTFWMSLTWTTTLVKSAHKHLFISTCPLRLFWTSATLPTASQYGIAIALPHTGKHCRGWRRLPNASLFLHPPLRLSSASSVCGQTASSGTPLSPVTEACPPPLLQNSLFQDQQERLFLFKCHLAKLSPSHSFNDWTFLSPNPPNSPSKVCTFLLPSTMDPVSHSLLQTFALCQPAGCWPLLTYHCPLPHCCTIYALTCQYIFMPLSMLYISVLYWYSTVYTVHIYIFIHSYTAHILYIMSATSITRTCIFAVIPAHFTRTHTHP